MAAPELSAVGKLARDDDEARFLAALLAPVQSREALFALIAFNAELAKIPISVSEPMLGEIRLTWWREALADLFDRGTVQGHEIIEALAEAHKARPLARDGLEALIDARLFSLSDEAANAEAVSDFLRDTGGVYQQLAVGALGGNEAAQKVAALAGWAEGAGRLIVATQISAMGGAAAPFSPAVDADALSSGAGADELKQSLSRLAVQGLDKLMQARSHRRDVPPAMRAPLLSVHVAERALRAAAAPDFNPALIDAPSPFRARAALLARALSGRF